MTSNSMNPFLLGGIGSNDPAQDDYNNAVDQWLAMQQQAEQQKAQLAQMLSIMETMKDPFAAFAYAEQNVLPAVMQCTGNQIGSTSSTENVSSAMREFITNMQNLFNKGSAFDQNSTGGGPDAQNFAAYFQDFYTTLQQAANDPSGNGPISQSTAKGLLITMDQIGSTIGGTTYQPGTGVISPSNIDNLMHAWFGSGPTTPVPASMTDGFQSMNADVSSVSTTATSQEQFYNNLYNQEQGVLSNMFSNSNSLLTQMVANEKSQ